MSAASDLVNKLRRRGFVLTTDAGKITVRSPNGGLPKDDRAHLKLYRSGVINFVQDRHANDPNLSTLVKVWRKATGGSNDDFLAALYDITKCDFALRNPTLEELRVLRATLCPNCGSEMTEPMPDWLHCKWCGWQGRKP